MSDRGESYPARRGGLYVPPGNKTNIYPFQILWSSPKMIHYLLHASPSFVPSEHFPRQPPNTIGSRTAGLLPDCIRHVKRQETRRDRAKPEKTEQTAGLTESSSQRSRHSPTPQKPPKHSPYHW